MTQTIQSKKSSSNPNPNQSDQSAKLELSTIQQSKTQMQRTQIFFASCRNYLLTSTINVNDEK
jgi:hypothetical protein